MWFFARRRTIWKCFQNYSNKNNFRKNCNIFSLYFFCFFAIIFRLVKRSDFFATHFTKVIRETCCVLRWLNQLENNCCFFFFLRGHGYKKQKNCAYTVANTIDLRHCRRQLALRPDEFTKTIRVLTLYLLRFLREVKVGSLPQSLHAFVDIELWTLNIELSLPLFSRRVALYSQKLLFTRDKSHYVTNYHAWIPVNDIIIFVYKEKVRFRRSH